MITDPPYILLSLCNAKSILIHILFGVYVLIKRVLYPRSKTNMFCGKFVLYLKIINTFLKNDISILKQFIQGTQTWHWKFSRQGVFKLWIKTVKICYFLVRGVHVVPPLRLSTRNSTNPNHNKSYKFDFHKHHL